METMEHRIYQAIKTQLEIKNCKEKVKQLDLQQIDLEKWTYTILGVFVAVAILFFAL